MNSMRNKFGLALIVLFMAMSQLIGQVKVNVGSVSGESGTTIDIPFTVENYNMINGFQLSVNFDAAALQYVEPVDLNAASGLSLSDFLGQSQTGSSTINAVTVLYFNSAGDEVSLPDGTVLFKLRFNILGSIGTSTEVSISGDPLEIVFASNDGEFEYEFSAGTITVEGVDPNALTVTAPNVFTPSGSNVCLPITVTNFDSIQSGGGNFYFDSQVLTYTGVKNIHPVLVAANFKEGNFAIDPQDPNRLTFVYFNGSPSTQVIVPDNEAIFEICFDAIGANGTMSVIDLKDHPDSDFYFSKENGDVNIQLIDGKVTIQEGEPMNLTFGIDNQTVIKGKNVCLDLKVQNFVDIENMQLGLGFDESQLSFTEGMGTGALPNIDIANPSATSDKINMIWTDANTPRTLEDNTVIAKLCFDVVGDCDGTTEVKVGNNGEFTDLADNTDGPISPIDFNSATLSIVCEPDCEVVRVDPACDGSSNGNVIVNIEDACECTWKNSAGETVFTGTGGNCNLLEVAAGTYNLEVTCPGDQPGCMLEVTVPTQTAVGLSGEVIYDGCTEMASIQLSTTVNGTFTYTWTPAVNNDTNPTGLDAGVYTVVVKNTETSCEESMTFTIEENYDYTLRFGDVNVTNTNCADDGTGAIDVSVLGGCGDLTYSWSPNISTNGQASGLNAGTYTLTVADSSNPSVSITQEIEVGATSDIAINPVTVGSDGANGKITLNATGGVAPYTYSWVPNTLPNADEITGLTPGEYRVTITDANGCSFTSDVIIVPDNTASGVAATAEATTNVLCFSDETGVVSGVLSKGATPVTIALSGAASRELVVNALGGYTFENLPAGAYTLTITDANNSTLTISNVEITEPEKIEITIPADDLKCAKQNSCDGAFSLNVSGGVTPYNYQWSDTSIEGDRGDGLCIGNYNVIVTDDNNCRAMATVSIVDCDNQGSCYVADKVITPNGDGRNDVFTISCLDNASGKALSVYDRWGREVYTSNNYGNDWNGMDTDDANLNESTYMWVLRLTFDSGNSRIEKGYVTVLRN